MPSAIMSGLLGAAAKAGQLADDQIKAESEREFRQFLEQLTARADTRRHGQDLERLGKSHDLDLERLGKSHDLTLAQLAQQHQYDMARQGASDAAAMARTKAGKQQMVTDAEGGVWLLDDAGKLSPVQRPMGVEEWGQAVGPLLEGEVAAPGQFDSDHPPTTQLKTTPKADSTQTKVIEALLKQRTELFKTKADPIIASNPERLADLDQQLVALDANLKRLGVDLSVAGAGASQAGAGAAPSQGLAGKEAETAIARPQSKADYDQLPPGARYYDPNGVLRTKGGG